jgi:hypothetical protein
MLECAFGSGWSSRLSPAGSGTSHPHRRPAEVEQRGGSAVGPVLTWWLFTLQPRGDFLQNGSDHTVWAVSAVPSSVAAQQTFKGQKSLRPSLRST